MRAACCIFGLLLFSGCAGDAREAAAVRDSAGITIVENAAPTASRVHRAELRLSIGEEDGPIEYQFYQVSSVARLRGGGIVVGEAESGRLRWFDGTGRVVHAAGGIGAGPGEFRYIAAVIPMADDSVAVWGGLLDSVSIFDSTGAYVRREPLDRARIGELVGPEHMTEGIEPLPDGSFVLVVYDREDGSPPPGGVHRPALQYHRVSRDLTRVDTLGMYGGWPQVMVDVGQASPWPAVLDFPVHARLSAGGEPVRIYAGNGERFEIHGFDARGRMDRIIRLSLPLRQVRPEERDAARNRTRAWAERQNLGAVMERAFAALPEQPYFPAYDALKASTDGGVWVRAWVAPMDSLAAWHVFDRSGEWNRTVHLPAGFTAHQVGDGWILGVERDTLEVERVRMYTFD